MARRVFIGGNWKMQASSAKVNEIIKMLNDACFQETSRDIVVAPSYLFLSHVKSQLRKEFKVAAQNCCHKPTGAFTGEVSPQMIKDIGLEWVILGHSERRHIFKETDDIISQKIALAIESGLHVIACIGETLEQREAQQTETVLKSQLDPIANAIKDWSRAVIAYEPVWAIGTGVVATPEQAQTAHSFLRNYLKYKVSQTVADSTRIIYGGSVNGENVEDLFKQPDIDGFLVGGASLNNSFIKIINCKR